MLTFARPSRLAMPASAPGLSLVYTHNTVVSPTSRPRRLRTVFAFAALSGTSLMMLYSKPPEASTASRLTLAFASAAVTAASVPGLLGRTIESSFFVAIEGPPRLVRHGVGVRASANRVQFERTGFLHQLRAFRAGIDPQFFATFLRDVVEHLHADGRR